MSDKIKACCENCENWSKSEGKSIWDGVCCEKTYDLVGHKCKDVCSHYIGTGQTPEARIAELEDENADLYEALTIAYLKGKAYENAEKLDAKEIEPKACDDCWLMRDFGRYIPAGYCANGKCAKIYNAFAKESEVRNG